MDLGDPGTASDPLGLFCARLRRLQRASGIRQAGLLGAVGLKRSQVSDILNGKIERPPDWVVTIAIVRACLEHAKAAGSLVPPDLSDEADWQRRYFDLEQDLDNRARARPHREEPTGRLLAEVTDPFALEVHRPVQPDAPQPGLPALPAYVAREHDLELERVVAAAAEGGSVIAVLVGGSSTGKTRACWEALRPLRDRPEQWRIWHPIDPTRPDAALRELPLLDPRTVVWLNEAQFYLDVAADELGERIAAGLREALRDPGRAPVLVLATLWPEHWATLTARPPAGGDPHAQARELLAGRDITVPAAFTAGQLLRLPASGDTRLALAAGAAEDGQVIQFLAGASELIARYRNAPPAAGALISAAMDARRMGMGIALPLVFLEVAAPGYLTDTEWDGLGEDWLEQALAYTVAPCMGVRGPLARIRTRTIRSTGPAPGSAYRLADYLEQHGRRARRTRIPPPAFWEAAARFAHPSDFPALASAAEKRGLLRDAARLRKYAAACGNASQAALLVSRWQSHHPYSADQTPARWAAAHASLDDPQAVAELLGALREAGADEQAAALLARDPAAHASLNKPAAVTELLGALRKAGADEQAAILLARDHAAHASLDDPWAVDKLLNALWEAGADEQAAALAARAATQASLDDSWFAFVHLIGTMLHAGAKGQAAILATRLASHISPESSLAVGAIQFCLEEVGADEQAAALSARAATHASRERQRTAAMLASDPGAHASLDAPQAIGLLIRALREVSADEQAAVLAARPATHGSLEDPQTVNHLLHDLRDAGADEQAKKLVDRLPAEGQFDLFRVQAEYEEQCVYGRECDETYALPWDWDDFD